MNANRRSDNGKPTTQFRFPDCLATNKSLDVGMAAELVLAARRARSTSDRSTSAITAGR